MDKRITKQNHDNKTQGVSLVLWYVCTHELYNFCSQMTYEVTFFVPCFNEEDNILSTLSTIQKVIHDFDINFEIMLVSDGSTDATISLALGHEIRNVKNCALELFDEKQNKGLGFRYIEAAKKCRGSYFMLINGDNVETVEQIKTILNHKGQADSIVPFFGKNDSRSIFRRNLSLVFTRVINLISGNKLKYYNGAVLHKSQNLKQLNFAVSGYAYQCEILCELISRGISYMEIPVTNSDRQWGVSKAFRAANFVSVAKSAWLILFRRIRLNKSKI
jgi:glycosyltransferase involved in cell wall biosynthesis